MNTKKSYRANRKKNTDTVSESDTNKTEYNRTVRNERAYKNSINKRTNAVIRHGGKCAMCGYDKSIAALDFHHVETRSKTPLQGCSISEYEKCVLICSNCHREHHNGGMEY